MSHEVETMAYANEVPWHGLGNKVDPNVSVEKMLTAAGLDWEVKQHKVYTKIGRTEIELPRLALVRETDKKVLTITGTEWKPLQNRDTLQFFRDWTKAGGARLETAGSLRGGKVVWGLASINAGFKLNGKDAVKAYILLTSPHEVGKAIQLRTTGVRVVCANTMAAAFSSSNLHYSQNHLKDFDVAAAKETVKLAKEAMEQLHLDAKALQQLKMSESDSVRFLASFFQPAEAGEDERKQAKALINDPSLQNKNMKSVLWAMDKAPGATPGNGWGVFNAVTYWADHMAGRERDARIFRSWLGHTGSTKEKVKQELLELVK